MIRTELSSVDEIKRRTEPSSVEESREGQNRVPLKNHEKSRTEFRSSAIKLRNCSFGKRKNDASIRPLTGSSIERN